MARGVGYPQQLPRNSNFFRLISFYLVFLPSYGIAHAYNHIHPYPLSYLIELPPPRPLFRTNRPFWSSIVADARSIVKWLGRGRGGHALMMACYGMAYYDMQSN